MHFFSFYMFDFDFSILDLVRFVAIMKSIVLLKILAYFSFEFLLFNISVLDFPS